MHVLFCISEEGKNSNAQNFFFHKDDDKKIYTKVKKQEDSCRRLHK